MPGLIRDTITFIKTLVIFLPILISSGTVLLSVYNQDLKSIPFLIFALICMFLGLGISKMWPYARANRVKVSRQQSPHGWYYNQQVPPPSITCNIISDGWEWGTLKSMPDAHALFLAFFTTYIITCGAVNSKNNGLIIAILITLTLLSAGFRSAYPMNCSSPQDILMGWFIGIVVGLGAVAACVGIENNSNFRLTYFNEPSDAERCTLGDSEYRCSVVQDP